MDHAALLLRIDGRINRANIGWRRSFCAIVNVLLSLFDRAWDQKRWLRSATLSINIGVFVSGLAAGAKRLHDRDRSAWWPLLYYLLPSVLLVWILVDVEMGSNVTMRYVSLFLALLVIWMLEASHRRFCS